MLPLHLKNFEIQQYYQNESRFKGVYSKDNLPNKIKDGAYNLDEYEDVDTHWISLYCKDIEIIYFDSATVENLKNLLDIKI